MNQEPNKIKCPVCGATYIVNHNLEGVLKAGNAIYYRPHKHRHWKHEKYEVIVGDVIVKTVVTKDSAEVLVNLLRTAFTSLAVTQLEATKRQAIIEFRDRIGDEEQPKFSSGGATYGDTEHDHAAVIFGRNELREELLHTLTKEEQR